MSSNQSNRGRGHYPRNGNPSANSTGNNNSTSSNARGSARTPFSQEEGRQITERREISAQISGDGTDNLIITGDARSRENLQQLAFIVLRNSRPFENPNSIRRFVNSCLINLSNHHDVDTSSLLISLSSTNGIERATDIMLRAMSIDAGKGTTHLSFQYVVIPFIGLLTREKVCQTTMVQHVNAIYTNVYLHSEQFLLKGILRCMDELIERGSLEDSLISFYHMQRYDPTTCTVGSFSCALLIITRLVFQLLMRIMDARFEDKFQQIVERLNSQLLRCKVLPSNVAGSAYECEVLTREIGRLDAIISDAKGLTAKSDERAKAVAKARSFRAHSGIAMANVEFLERNFDPPGDLSENGPRHDNDLLEIVEISIIPTHEEMTCNRSPYLPANGVAGAPHFIEAGWKRQLDIHFRLFREDMLDPLRKGISAFLRLLQDTSQTKKVALEKQGSLRNVMDENVNLNVYSGVRIHGLRLTKQHRVTVEISFEPPKSIRKKTEVKRREFWERSKAPLMQGGLVCLLWKSASTSDSPFGMIFGAITDRDVKQLSANPERAIITIALSDPSVYLTILEDAELNGGTRQVEHFMVESPNVSFDSYRPILSALQQKSYTPANLPFGRYLAPTADQAALPHTREEFIDPPLYTRMPGFFFDLSILLKDNETCHLYVTDRESQVNTVRTLMQHTELDDTQSQALVETLSREVALIKGPPGTGKTKIGVDLMRILLHNANKMNYGPILCICYTNHALDQFLEHLLEKKIKGIVRIGHRSKSEQLQEYNLEQLTRMQAKSFSTRTTLRDARSQWDDVSLNLMEIDQTLNKGTLPWKFLSAHLMERCYEQYRQLNPLMDDVQDADDKTDQDGFKVVDKTGKDGYKVVEKKRVKDPYLRWISGSDIKRKQEYLEELQKATSHVVIPNNNIYKHLSQDANSDDVDSIADQPSSGDIDMKQISIPTTNRPLCQLEQNSDMWNMSMEERQLLNDSWKRPVRESMLEELSRLLKNCQTIEQNINDANDEVRRLILTKASVIGMTTHGAAKYQTLISSVAPKIIICEEAGEVLESHILATLSPSTQHLILIGDPLQLRPQIATYNLSADSAIGKNYNLDKSLFERLVTPSLNPLPMSYLTTQRRMRPEIADLVRHTLYPKLIDSGNALKYPPVGGMMMNLYFMSHSQPEDQKDQMEMQSFSNSFEVDMVEALVQYLIRNGYNQPGDIAVLTPYIGQLVKLRDKMKKSFVIVIDERDQEQLDEIDLQIQEGGEGSGLDQSSLRSNVRPMSLQQHVTLRTIDNYQGEEAKIVIISLVRNIRTQDGAGRGIGFLKSPNRTNVLLSRAQHGMYLIGNAELLVRASNEAGLWPKVVDELREEDRIGPGFHIKCQRHPDTQRLIDTAEQFKIWAPHGGCNLPCSYVMDCGHTCPYQCHSDDPRHETVKCLQPCLRLHNVCNHVCPKQCGDNCGNCMEIVEGVSLPCGHTYNNPLCWQAKDTSVITCKISVIRKMITCEHEVSMWCSANVINERCTKSCGEALLCGHPCTRHCCYCQELTKNASKKQTDAEKSDDIKRTSHGSCRQVCDRTLFCGHACVKPCHPEEDCPPCEKQCVTRCVHFTCKRPCNEKCPACCEPCVWECLHGERCPLPCGVPCNRLPCNKRCGKALDCGHRCPSVCGEVCPPKTFCVLCADEKTKDMIVDLVMQQSLREVDIDEDPLLVLSCGHALTMSSLDGMMEMSKYYVESGAITEACPEFTACRLLPSEEVKQQACHLCRKPIVELHRYGRRIKFAQLSIRSKKYIKEQQTKVKKAKAKLQAAQRGLEKAGPEFISWIAKTLKSPLEAQKSNAVENPNVVEEPDLQTRLLRYNRPNQRPSPTMHFENIMTIYSIPSEQANRWKRHISSLLKCHRAFVEIHESACISPAKQLFDAAVSHLYRFKTVGSTGQFGSTDNSRITDIAQAPSSTVISECIRECGIPPGGMDGSSSMESFQEIINVQFILHQQAINVMDTVGTSSGWYWFASDLIHSILLHAERLIVAAAEAKYLRHLAYAQLSLMSALPKKILLLGRKPAATYEMMTERRQLVDLLSQKFHKQQTELRESCPPMIQAECLARIEVLEKDMESAIEVAKSGDFYNEVTNEEKLQLFSAMLPEVGGAGHWFRCPNNHPYTIGECGGAMQQSTCPECGAAIGGGSHILIAGNTEYTEFQGMEFEDN